MCFLNSILCLITISEFCFVTMQHSNCNLQFSLIGQTCIVHYESLDTSTNSVVIDTSTNSVAIRLKTLKTKCDEWKEFNLTETEKE